MIDWEYIGICLGGTVIFVIATLFVIAVIRSLWWAAFTRWSDY